MNLPDGTVTFLFTDIEGSTRLWEEHPAAMRSALARHDALLREAIESNSGFVFKTVGDAFCAVFPTASNALEAALDAQRRLKAQDWQEVGDLRVRMALHTGTAEARDNDYFGGTLNRVARLLAIGHGGQILLSQVTCDLVRAHLPAGCSLRDLSAHRLKDLLQPEHVWQLLSPDLPADFPRLRSLQSFSNNLPMQTSSFIGRANELEEIKGLLASCRFLTLTGAGGCGKTRLALQAAAEVLEQFPDGVWLAEFGALFDGGLVPQTVAMALGLREEPGRTIAETLVDFLRAKSLLLVLDNCEHLVDACAALSDTLLKSCPQLTLLATSRQSLAVPGETVWRVPSLWPPDPDNLPTHAKDFPDTLLDYDAVHLFVTRAREQQRTFTLTRRNAPAVAVVCHRLDGIPLAIELAAARVRAMEVGQIAERLSDRFRLLTGGGRTAASRQQTLRATMDWSYDLLTETERLLLCRLSVFAGGWTLEAAEAICSGGEIEAADVLDVLTSLVDKSLVIFEESEEGRGRYRLLETIRQYGSERLLNTEEAFALRQRHIAYFTTLAEQQEPDIHGPAQKATLDLLEREHDNFRVALDTCAPEQGIRLAGVLIWFWHLHNHLSEGRSRLESFLAQTEDQGCTRERARALHGVGQLAFYQADYHAVVLNLEKSVALWREIGDRRGLAGALQYLGGPYLVWGEQEKAAAFSQECTDCARASGDPWTLAMALWLQGTRFHFTGDGERGEPLLEESVVLFRQVGDAWGLIGPLIYLSEAKMTRNDPAAARVLITEALAAARAIGDKWRISVTLDTLGEAALCEGDAASARHCFEESLVVSHDMQNSRRIAYEHRNLGHAARMEGNWTEAQSHYIESLRLYRQLEDKRHLGNVLDGLARLAAEKGEAARSARLFGAVEALREAINVTVISYERGDHERCVAIARQNLGEETLASAWAEGRSMSLEQAIEFALEEAS